MQKLILFFSTLLAIASCTKIENKNYDSQNETDILNYLEKNNIDAEKTESGLYYVIEKQGDGLQPNSHSDVLVSFKANYLDGKDFAKSDEFGYAFNLRQIISGWAEGIAMLKEGGEAKLIIPSRLAYGNHDFSSIPAGSVFVFDTKLLSTKEGIDKLNDVQIKDYLEKNNLIAEKSTSGLYYIIDSIGTGDMPNTNSNVQVKYKGYFLNGDVFDETENDTASFNLQKVIPGFQEGLLHFNEGGTGTVLIPCTLGYGFYGSRSIPAGAVIAFDVELIKVD